MSARSYLQMLAEGNEFGTSNKLKDTCTWIGEGLHRSSKELEISRVDDVRQKASYVGTCGFRNPE